MTSFHLFTQPKVENRACFDGILQCTDSEPNLLELNAVGTIYNLFSRLQSLNEHLRVKGTREGLNNHLGSYR